MAITAMQCPVRLNQPTQRGEGIVITASSHDWCSLMRRAALLQGVRLLRSERRGHVLEWARGVASAQTLAVGHERGPELQRNWTMDRRPGDGSGARSVFIALSPPSAPRCPLSSVLCPLSAVLCWTRPGKLL